MPMTKLHLGCGGEIREGYVNIDIQLPFDLQHDFRKPLPFADASVDEIYSHDVIQVFSREEWKFVKKDWARVLKPGGIMMISVWDFTWVLLEFLKHPDDPYAMQRIYAGQDGEYDYFKNGFTWSKLVNDFQEEGMTDFKRDPYEEMFIHMICKKL